MSIKPPFLPTGLKGFWRRVTNSGQRRHCPICDARCRSFRGGGQVNAAIERHEIVGAGYHPDHRCPICGSRRRERLVHLFLHNKTMFFDGQPRQMLHVAPERALGGILAALPNLDYVAGDLNPSTGQARVDITAIDFGDASFDVLLCNHVLEHVLDDSLAVREIYRVTKPGGFAILQVPIGNALTATYEDPEVTSLEAREREFGQCDHVRIYSLDDYRTRLAAAGFEVEVFFWPSHNGFGGEANLYGLDTQEPVFYCRRIDSATNSASFA